MCSVTHIIRRIARPVDGIDAVHIIDAYVRVVVDLVVGNLIRVDPNLVRQILVRIADARVNDGHEHIG